MQSNEINLRESLSSFQIFPPPVLNTSTRKIHSQFNRNHSSQRHLLTAPPCSIKQSGCSDHKSLCLPLSRLCIVSKAPFSLPESEILVAWHIPASPVSDSRDKPAHIHGSEVAVVQRHRLASLCVHRDCVQRDRVHRDRVFAVLSCLEIW